MTYLKDRKGRGEGSGDAYDPYYHIQDRSTRKSSERIPSPTGGRNIHVLGREETAAFYLYSWSPNEIDISEQFPLKIEKTQEIAKDCRLHHPTRKGVPRVIACTFRLHYLQKGREQIAFRTVAKLSTIPSMLVELELQRQYFEQQGADWGIITDEDIPWNMARNIEHIYGLRNLDNPSRFPDEIRERQNEIKQVLLVAAAEEGRSIETLVSIASSRLQLDTSHLVNFCWHLIFKRVLSVDMNSEIQIHGTIIRPYNHKLEVGQKYVSDTYQ